MKITLCLFVFYLFGCTQDNEPVSAKGPTYQTPYGTITQLDTSPLFVCNYTVDYKFDEYLETGTTPFYAAGYTTGDQFGCTCFSTFGGDNRLLGRNYDWPERRASYIVFTDPPQGYRSVSTVDMYFFNYNPDESPADAGNQNTVRLLPYFPFDGMNEKGVAVGMNALEKGRGPVDEGKITIGELQMIRLVLDYAASTDEAIDLIQQYNIRMEDPPIHYLIADSSGHSVIIEFIDGQMIVMENQNPWQVTTNFIISAYQNPLSVPCWRYQTACAALDTAEGNLSEIDAFNLLQQVSVPTTRWSALFNLRTGKIHVSMGRVYEKLHQFNVY